MRGRRSEGATSEGVEELGCKQVRVWRSEGEDVEE